MRIQKCCVFVVLCMLSVSAIAAVTEKPRLSLNDAILLAVRENPNVQISQLSHVTAKFSLWVQRWEFLPHYSLEANATWRNTSSFNDSKGSHAYELKPGVSLLTPYGTKFALSASNAKTKHYNPGVGIEITQPLMRGFGRPIVESALKDAIDSEKVSRLNIEGTLRTTVTDVISAYLDVVTAEQTIKIDEKAVERAERSVQQTELFIKAGRKAGTELVTVQANVASAKSNLENDKNNLANARYALLTAIGLDPNAPIIFDELNLDALLKKYGVPSLERTKALVLENDIQYQTSKITLYGPDTRAVMIAEDRTRPILDFKANLSTGGASGGGRYAGWNSVWNGANRAQSVGLSLQIPIDDQISKQGLLNARIALKKAQIGLKQDKWRKETSAINGWNLVRSKERALKFALDAEALQASTYNLSYQKYIHGLIDSLELQSAQLSLIQSQQALLSARISYIKALVDLDNLIGNTLNTWNIKIRF